MVKKDFSQDIKILIDYIPNSNKLKERADRYLQILTEEGYPVEYGMDIRTCTLFVMRDGSLCYGSDDKTIIVRYLFKTGSLGLTIGVNLEKEIDFEEELKNLRFILLTNTILKGLVIMDLIIGLVLKTNV